jgi:regulator of nucleoside diphosphate kinase
VKRQSIVITDSDMERLSCFVRGACHSLFRDHQQVDLLDNVLQSAEVRPSHSTPKSVVRMRSKVQVRDIRTCREDVYTVVFPDDANVSLGLISVLAPIGIALLGRRKGAVVDASVPGGIRRLRIVQVIQSPDSCGRNEPAHSRQITLPNLVGEERVAA